MHAARRPRPECGCGQKKRATPCRTRRSCQSGAHGSPVSQPSLPEPAARDPEVRETLVGGAQHVEQRRARHLVVVDAEDPVAAAERVEPLERPLDWIGEGVGDEDVCELLDPFEPLALRRRSSTATTISSATGRRSSSSAPTRSGGPPARQQTESTLRRLPPAAHDGLDRDSRSFHESSGACRGCCHDGDRFASGEYAPCLTDVSCM